MAFTDDNDQKENQNVISEANSMDLVKVLKNVGSFYRKQVVNRLRDHDGKIITRYSKVRVNFKVRITFGIIPNKYKLKELLEKLQIEIRSFGLELQSTKVVYNKDTDRVTITGNTQKFMIFSYSKNSLLPMLGYTNQIITNRNKMLERENCCNENGKLTCVPQTDDEI